MIIYYYDIYIYDIFCSICMLRLSSNPGDLALGFADHPALGHGARWWCTFSTPLAEAFPKVPWWKDGKFLCSGGQIKDRNWHPQSQHGSRPRNMLPRVIYTCYWTYSTRIPKQYSNTLLRLFFFGCVCVCLFVPFADALSGLVVPTSNLDSS